MVELGTILAGGASGAVVDLVMFPVDTLKTRLQASRSGQAAVKSMSLRSFYNGIVPSMVVSFPSAATFWTSYEYGKATLVPACERAGVGWLGPMLAAGAAEIAVAIVRNPFEVVKQQLQTGMHSGSSAVAVRTILSSRMGWRGLYAGALPTVLRDIPFDAVQFGLYEKLKGSLLDKRQAEAAAGGESAGTGLPGWQYSALGMLSGGVAAAVTTPLDVIKTRLMTQAGAGPAVPRGATAAGGGAAGGREVLYKGAWDCAVRIWKEEGPAVLLSGIKPRVAWISLGGAIYIGFFEWAKPTFTSAGAAQQGRPE